MRRNFLLMMFAILLLGGCKKDKEVRIYTITEKTPTVDVAVTSVSIRGYYYGYPSDLKSVTVAYTQNSDYSSASTILAENHNVYGADDYYYARLINLEPNTTYYYYCIFDTGYGSAEGKQWSFTTQSVSATAVTTSSVSNITQTTATCGGNVTSDGGATVTARGVCWGTSQDPTVSNSHTTDGSGTGSFMSNITGLTENTTYYVRAYATNSAGTSYGEQESFTTQTTPTVTTSSVSNISQTTATCGGNVTSDGGAAVTARGVCWSTSPSPMVSNSHTTDGTGTGSFTSSITGLTANTTYYVRAYATNSAGTSYGEQESFTTQSGGGTSGRFSVSSTTTVEFAPGNLYWDGSAFRFEANQWDFRHYNGKTNDAAVIDGISMTTPAGTVGSFFWSKTASAAYASSYSDSGASTDDVFFTEASGFQASGETAGTWRTLSKAEWNYLLNSRDNASSLRVWKELDGGTHKGLVILPDGTDASVMSSISSTSDLATHGAVFLPAAGYRYVTDVSDVGSDGDYWSSTPYEDDEGGAYGMYFSSGSVSTGSGGRYGGHAVRLVR